MNKLDQAAVSLLNNLVEICRDGYFAYREALHCIKSAELQGYFNLVSQERMRFGQELLLELFKSDGELGRHSPHTLERPLPWQVVEHRLRNQEDKFVLRELARLEDGSLKLYDSARRKEWPAELRALLERQCADIKRVRDHVCAESAAAFRQLSVTAVSKTTPRRRTHTASP